MYSNTVRAHTHIHTHVSSRLLPTPATTAAVGTTQPCPHFVREKKEGFPVTAFFMLPPPPSPLPTHPTLAPFSPPPPPPHLLRPFVQTTFTIMVAITNCPLSLQPISTRFQQIVFLSLSLVVSRRRISITVSTAEQKAPVSALVRKPTLASQSLLSHFLYYYFCLSVRET